MNVNTLTLDVSKEPAHEPTIYLGQGDKNGTTLVVKLFDNGAVLDLTDLTATFCMRTPGDTDYYTVAGTVSGNTATFTIDETYAAGHVGSTDVAYVKVADGDTTITSTSRIRVTILPSATDGVEPAPAYQTLIEQFISEAQADIDEAVAAAEAIVDYSVPLMSATMRGGAKLGDGLSVADDKLSIGSLTKSDTGATVTTDGCAIYGVNGEGWAEQDGTPTPDNPVEIRVARGRNLLNEQTFHQGGINGTDGNLTTSSTRITSAYISVSPSTQYTLTFADGFKIELYEYDANQAYLRKTVTWRSSGYVITTQSTTAFVRALIAKNNDIDILPNVAVTACPQLELGTAPTPYVPYGHVGLEVKLNGVLQSCTPVPIPSKGFAASLPDGTADALTVDSAGRYEWTNNAWEVVFDGSSDEGWQYSSMQNGFRLYGMTDVFSNIPNNSVNLLATHFMPHVWDNGTTDGAIEFLSGAPLCTHSGISQDVSSWRAWLASNPVTLLYPLATPTIEHGYIDLPSLPEGATVSIPELTSIGVEWWIMGADAIVEHVSNERKRAEAKYAEIAEAIADL